MIFDSKKQQAQITRMVLESPITTTIEGLIAGPSEELFDLVNSLKSGLVASRDDQVKMMALVEGVEKD